MNAFPLFERCPKCGVVAYERISTESGDNYQCRICGLRGPKRRNAAKRASLGRLSRRRKWFQ